MRAQGQAVARALKHGCHGPGLAAQYRQALRSYLRRPGEEALARASGLGRQALSSGLGVLDVVAMHHTGLARLASRSRPLCPPLETAAVFLTEALSCFEITHRGFREATQLMARTVWLAAVVSHELRTPLTSIMSSAGVLREVLDAEPASVEGRLLGNILSGAGILKARTDDLMELVALHSGALRIRPGPVEAGELLNEVAQRLRPRIEEAGMRLRLSLAEGLPVLFADRGRLEQVVSNLVENAVKYGSQGGRLDLRARATATAVLMEVEDYGPGISLRDRVRLFQPYFRGGHEVANVPGLGVGLALCEELVRLHHGRITVRSRSGRGSLFRVELPLPERVRKKGAVDDGSDH